MIDVDEAYAVLLADVWGKSKQSPLYVRPSGVETPESEVLLAADADGRRHLLVPLPADYELASQSGKSLTLSARSLVTKGTTRSYGDLACLESGLDRVFSGLVRDALNRVASDPEHAVSRLEQALQEWRKLLAQSRPMSEEAARGLFGELLALTTLASVNPVRAVECWSGPDQAVQDFRSSHGAIEVKTTVREDLSVKISSLDQLDPAGLPFLVLAYIRLEQGPAGASTLDDVIHGLIKLDVPEVELIEKAAKYGHLYREGVNDHLRFTVVDRRFWLVGSEFPGLRRSDLPAHRSDPVSSLSYRLSLVGAPNALTPGEARERMEAMLGGD